MGYRYETQFNSPNYTPASQVLAAYGVQPTKTGATEHWWGAPNTGATYEGVISWLCRPGGNTSAHYVVDGPTRRVACLVSPFDAAWHAGSARGNASTIGVENNPNTAAKASTTDVTSELLADLRDPNAFGDILLYGHNNWNATQCPGHFDINEIDRISYTKQPGTAWGDVKDKVTATPPPPPPVVVVPPAPVVAEWVRNIKDITDSKLIVLPAAGAYVYDLNTLQVVPNSIIPKGTSVDIAKETTIAGKLFYISSYSASKGMARGVLASELGVPAVPPVQEKPEWVKNLKDIADIDMWTRSETPVLRLADGSTERKLPINTKVRVIKSTSILGQALLVLDGETTCIEPIYLSTTPISNPNDHLAARVSTLEALVKGIIDFLSSIFTGYKK